jgi:hypothetical protein
MVAILAAVLTDGLPAVVSTCAQAVAEGVHSYDVIINILVATRSRTGGNHPHPQWADALACAGRRLRPIRLEHVIMERIEVLDMMTTAIFFTRMVVPL